MPLDWLTEDLPTPSEIKLAQSASVSDLNFVQKSRDTIIDILEGKDPRKLLIVGPCSMHDPIANYDYAMRLKSIKDQISDTFFLIMRVYFEKPRTSLGWKGYLHDPKLDGSHHIEEGLIETRKLLKKITAEEIPIAAEILDPSTPNYMIDLISWGCVGARTVTSQIHRQLASHLPLPMGFKNSIDGNVDVALHAIETSHYPHTFIGLNNNGRLSLVRSFGNPHSHLVLRGGESAPNYSPEKITEIAKKLRNKKLAERIIVDCSHDNSRKKHFNQIEVFNSVIDQIISGAPIRGLMLESFIEAGNQRINPFKPLRYGQSITDACLDISTTLSLILNGHKRLQESACATSSS